MLTLNKSTTSDTITYTGTTEDGVGLEIIVSKTSPLHATYNLDTNLYDYLTLISQIETGNTINEV